MPCIFCKIAAGEIAANTVLDEPDLVAFHDLHPQAPVHVLVIPREHIDNVAAARPEHAALLGRLLLAGVRVAAATGIGESCFRLVLNAGTYEYKFVLEGKTWKTDPANRRQAGYFNNSVLEVGGGPKGPRGGP